MKQTEPTTVTKITSQPSDLNGWKPLDDMELQILATRYRGDVDMKRLCGDYQRMRNIGKVGNESLDKAKQLINERMQNTNHLNLSDAVIVACQNIDALRGDISRYKIERADLLMEVRNIHARWDADSNRKDAFMWALAIACVIQLLVIASVFVR